MAAEEHTNPLAFVVFQGKKIRLWNPWYNIYTSFDFGYSHPLDRKHSNEKLMRTIPLSVWMEYGKWFNDNLEHIVSVGAGKGVFEWIIFPKRDPENIHLVDPDPSSYSGDVQQQFFPIKAPYLKDLIKKNPGLVGKAGLTLIWPPPGNERSSAYDIEAIKTLNPPAILVLYGIDGSSGSKFFHDWIKSQKDYSVVALFSSVDVGDIGMIRYPDVIKPTLVLLIKKDSGFKIPYLPSGKYYDDEDAARFHKEGPSEKEIMEKYTDPKERKFLEHQRDTAMHRLLAAFLEENAKK